MTLDVLKTLKGFRCLQDLMFTPSKMTGELMDPRENWLVKNVKRHFGLGREMTGTIGTITGTWI